MKRKRNIKLILAYDGTRYRGWQRLGDSDKTIQAKLEEILSRICGEPVEIIGSGRTDAGVHALGQCANFHTTAEILPGEILSGMNRYLPEDIAVLEASETDERFHARYNACSKTYLYRIRNSVIPDPFSRKVTWQIPEALDIDKMNAAARILEGDHDFQSFTATKPGKKSTVRDLEKIRLSLRQEEAASRIIEIRMSASGFLHNMARLITGTMVRAGKGEIDSREIERILESRQRSLAGPLAPPQGLFLEKVDYPR